MVAEVLAHLVIPVRDKFETGVADFTLVHHHRVETDGLRPAHGLFLDQVEGALVVVVQGHGKAVLEEIDVQTGVELLGGFPGKQLVHRLLRIPENTPVGVALHTVDGTFVPGAAVQVGRLIRPVDGTEVTHATPGSTELEEVHDVVLREERFAGNLPCARNGREVAVVVTGRETAGIVPAPGSGHEIAVVKAVRSAGDERDVGIDTVIVKGILGCGMGQILHIESLILVGLSACGESSPDIAVEGDGTQGADGMLAESAVEGEHVLAAPPQIATDVIVEAVATVRLADFGALRVEVLIPGAFHVSREQAAEFQALDRRDVEAGGGPEPAVVAVLIVGQEETERVHGVTVDVGEIAAVLGDVGGILCDSTAVGTGVRTGRSISFRAGRHIDGGEDGAGIGRTGIGAPGTAVGEGHVLGDLEPLVQVILAIVADTEILSEGVNEDAGVVLIAEGETALEVLGTIVQGHRMTLIEGVAENLVHPLGPGFADPRVLAHIPADRNRQTGIGIGKLAHLDFLLGIQRGREIGGGTDTGDQVIFDMDTLAGLLGGHEDDTAGTGSGTVDSGGGRVLQDDDALDVVHGDDRGARDAIDNPQDGVAVAGTLATDDHALAAGRLTAVVGDDHARDLALQHEGRARHRALDNLVGVVDDTHGSGQVLLLGLGAVTEGHGFL